MKTAYINGIILDGTKDMSPQTGKAIIVEDKKITSIESAEGLKLEGYKVVDLKGKYIVPGLINLHVHLPGTGKPSKVKINIDFLCKLLSGSVPGRKIAYGIIGKNAKTSLMAGITTIRSVATIENFDSVVRDEIKSGKRVGCRILTSDSAISVEGGHMAGSFAYIAHNASDARNLVDKIAKSKPDLIKLMITGGVLDSGKLGEPGVMRMPPEYIKAACDRAHELGFKVAAHCEGQEGVLEALRYGVDTIEHGAQPNDEIISLFKKNNSALIVTLLPAIPYCLALPGMLNYTEIASVNSKIVLDGMVELAKQLLKEGIPVGLGTDSSCTYATHYDFWRELKNFVHYVGVSDKYALYTATLGNAKIAGIDDITGSIEPGKYADMIVVKDDPSENVSALRNVDAVIFEGTLYDNPEVKKYPEVEQVWDEIQKKY